MEMFRKLIFGLAILVLLIVIGCHKPKGFQKMDLEYIHCHCVHRGYFHSFKNYDSLLQGNSSVGYSSEKHIALSANSDLDSIRDILTSVGCELLNDNIESDGKKYIIKVIYFAQGDRTKFKYFDGYLSKDGNAISIRGKVKNGTGGWDMEEYGDYFIINIPDSSITDIHTRIKVNESGLRNDFEINIDGVN